MKLITRDTDYAIRAICCIATSKKSIVSVDELVEHLKIPRPFLRKILQILNKKKIVRSYKGKGGGFLLHIVPNKLSLFDIITAFQGPIKLNEHTFKKKMCPLIKKCKIKKKIDRIEIILINELKRVTISSIMKNSETILWQKGK